MCWWRRCHSSSLSDERMMGGWPPGRASCAFACSFVRRALGRVPRGACLCSSIEARAFAPDRWSTRTNYQPNSMRGLTFCVSAKCHGMGRRRLFFELFWEENERGACVSVARSVVCSREEGARAKSNSLRARDRVQASSRAGGRKPKPKQRPFSFFFFFFGY